MHLLSKFHNHTRGETGKIISFRLSLHQVPFFPTPPAAAPPSEECKELTPIPRILVGSWQAITVTRKLLRVAIARLQCRRVAMECTPQCLGKAVRVQ